MKDSFQDNLAVLFSLLATGFSIYFIILRCYNNDANSVITQEVKYMDATIIAATIAAVAGLITTVINIWSRRKDKLDNLKALIGDDTSKLSISEQIGVKKGEPSIVNLIGVKKGEPSLVNIIGVKPGSNSLSKQHRQIKQLITSEKEERKKALETFTKAEHDTQMKLNEMELFFRDWEQKTTLVHDYEHRIQNYEQHIQKLEKQIAELSGQQQSQGKPSVGLMGKLDTAKETVKTSDENQSHHEHERSSIPR